MATLGRPEQTLFSYFTICCIIADITYQSRSKRPTAGEDAMTQGGFYERKRMSPTAVAIVVLLHGAAITALVMAKEPGFIRDITHTTLIDIHPVKPPPPQDPKPPKPQPRQPIEQITSVRPVDPPPMPTWTV